jgi:Prokaryotic phospholipase A2
VSKYWSVVVAVLAAATMLIAAQAAEARVVPQGEIASTFAAGSGHASGARPTGCWVAPCPSPKPQRECGNVVYSGSVWVVSERRVPCGSARALVLKLLRANPNLPGPGLPGWNCHDAKGVNPQGHCEDRSSPKGKVRAIFWWLNESGDPPLPPPLPPPPPPPPSRFQQLQHRADRIMRLAYPAFIKLKREKSKHPSPFDWNDDGCSGPVAIKEAYRHVFNQPCQLHDFGYRNYGRFDGLKLGRNEDVRHWIDKRFLREMRRLCNRKLRDLPRELNTCRGMARVVFWAVRLKGEDPFYNG